MSVFLQESEDDDDIKYYILPADTSIYRGDTAQYISIALNNDSLVLRKHEYFGFDTDSVDQYGIVGQFQSVRTLRLVALDDHHTLDTLISIEPELKDLLKKGFGAFRGKGKILIRDSDAKVDNQISGILCSMGYDGYATNNMVTEGDGRFHQEMLICSPSENVTFKSFNDKDDVIEEKIAEHKLRIIEKERVAAKKRRRTKATKATEGLSRSLF